MSMEAFIRQHKIKKFIKSIKDNKPSPGESLTLRQARGDEANPNVGTVKAPRESGNFPVGTIRNGRQKISAKPSVWVDINSGKSYDEHNSSDHHKAPDHPEIKKFKQDVMKKIQNTMDSNHLARAEQLFDKYIQERLHAKNMMRAGNIESSKIGALAEGHSKTHLKLSDSTEKHRQNFVKYVKQAQKVNREKNGG